MLVKIIVHRLAKYMDKEVSQIVDHLKLMPHPEGGFYRETYRSEGSSLVKFRNIEVTRNYSTCIYFLLTSGSFSAFHRIVQDECWHFYDGSPIILHMFVPPSVLSTKAKQAGYQKVVIGRNFSTGEVPQYTVPGGVWFASETLGKFSLAGCTVAPGFDFEDFELANSVALCSEFPDFTEVIQRLTRQ